jgi:hypothetical protein
VLNVLNDLDILFLKGGVFQSDATGLVTQKALAIIRGIGTVKFWSGYGSTKREIAATIPMPDFHDGVIDATTREDAARVYNVFKSFFDANFPAHELTNCYSCLDLEASLTWTQRRALLKPLCEHTIAGFLSASS